MITIVTSHDIEIFKLFYNHKGNDILKDDLYVYVDKEDPKEWVKIIKEGCIFSKKDLQSYYGDLYVDVPSPFSKIYLLNMLLHKQTIDSFYFTDDDVLLYDNSLKDIEKSDSIIFSKDEFFKADTIERFYKNWEPIYVWIKNQNFLRYCINASNFYVPKNHIEEFKINFFKIFDDFIKLYVTEKTHILNSYIKKQHTRRGYYPGFMMDTIFLNVVFSLLENCKGSTALYTSPSKFESTMRKLKEHKLPQYPKRQPVLHFNIGEKLVPMTDFFNEMNENKITIKNKNKLF